MASPYCFAALRVPTTMLDSRNPVLAEDLKQIASAPLPWTRFEGKRLLITGAAGYVPAYLVETLLYLNDTRFSTPARILGLVRDETRANKRFAHHGQRDDLVLIGQDVCSPIAVDGPIHFIIHAASPASPKYFGIDPVGTMDANVLGTHNLLRVANEKNVEGFLFFSTSEVYGNVSGGAAPIQERQYGGVDPLAVRSCYAEGKRAGETMCIAWHHQYGVPTRIVRPFHIYGPGMALDDGRVFADFVSNVVNGQDIVMKSDGTAVRSFCYIADATAAFFTALLLGQDGEAYNVGDQDGVISIGALARLLVDLFPDKKLEVVTQPVRSDKYLNSEFKVLVPDLTKVKGLGWHAHHTLEQGFERTVRSYL